MKLLALTTTSLAGLVSFASAAGFHKVCRKPSADHAASANRQALEPSSASPSATDSGVQASASSAAVDSTASNAASGLSTGASASASAVAPVESGANAASYAAANESLSARGSGDGRMVFAHYMLVAPPHNESVLLLFSFFGVCLLRVHEASTLTWLVPFPHLVTMSPR